MNPPWGPAALHGGAARDKRNADGLAASSPETRSILRRASERRHPRGRQRHAAPSADADHEQAPAADLRPADGRVRDRGARRRRARRADARHRRHARGRVLRALARQRPRVRRSSRSLYAYQERAGGIAEALGLARALRRRRARASSCSPTTSSSARSRRRSRTSRHQERGARVVLSRVAEPEHLRHLGVAELDGDGGSSRIVEKPADPPSEYAVTGRLLLRRRRSGTSCRRSSRPAAASSRSPT